MSRYVWPNSFMLYACERPDALRNKALPGLLNKLGAIIRESREGKQSTTKNMTMMTHVDTSINRGRGSLGGGTPVALRWSTSPALGFPRQPFKVWRRSRDYIFTDLEKGPLSFSSTRIVDWSLREMYVVRFVVSPASGASVHVQALDRTYQPIPGQVIDFNTSGGGMFTSPGITGLQITGRGDISDIEGVEQGTLANASGWERVQVVGFPYAPGETAPPVYDPQPQGYMPASLDGLTAARLRLFIAQVLHQPLPDTGIADFPTPSWPAADPALFLDYLRNGVPSAFWLVNECLAGTDDSNPSKLQSDFMREVITGGIKQADLPGATPDPANPTKMRLPVVGITMLSVSTGSDAATGLGYGTIDFPPATRPVPSKYREPAGTVHMDWDYMVTSDFIFPFFGSLEIAALAQPRPNPEPASGLTAATFQVNRAISPDGTCTESVRISWGLSFYPQAYAVLVSHASGDSNVLNSLRPVCGGHNPFVAVRPAGAGGSPPAGFRTIFNDPVSPLPVDGSLTSRYLVAGTDVFGRWSDWRMTTHIANALPVIKPGLLSAAFVQDVASSSGRVVPSKMEIEFSWDWADRSPDRIELTGRFISPTAASIPVSASGFALSPLGAPSATVIVSFGSTGNPYISSGHSGSVETLTVNPPDPDRRRYRLTLNGLSCDYTTANKVAYAVFARSAEAVRPGPTSDWVGPRRAEAPCPLPPSVPVLPIDLQWTALPDATGRARGVLSWPSASGTAKYAVWEATESALLSAVAPTAPPPTPGTTLLARAASLRSLLTASAAAQSLSLQAFSRMNTDLLAGTSIELVLPSGSSTIYAYRVSSIEPATNVESERSSTIALFAVPHRNKPGQPNLVLRRTAPTLAAPAGKIQVIALPTAGPTPVGYRVFRVRSAALLADPGMKGPPKISETATGWAPITLQTLKGSENGMAIEDTVGPSWYPYYYQVVALGLHNPTAGEYGGESTPSAVQPGFLPPPDAPTLTIISNTGNSTNRVITFRTNLPVKPTGQGKAVIELINAAVSSDGRSMERTAVLSAPTETVEQGAPFTVLPAPNPAQLAAMPQLNRGEIGTDEAVVMTVRFPASILHGSLVAVDPLSRTTQVDF